MLKSLPAQRIWIFNTTQCPSKDSLAPTGVSSVIHSDFVLNSETNLSPAARFCLQLAQLTTLLEQYCILVGKEILQALCQLGWPNTWRHPATMGKMANRTSTPLETCTFSLSSADILVIQFKQKSSFSHASVNGIGQISYLHKVNQRDKVHVSYLFTQDPRNRGNWPCEHKNYPSFHSQIEIVVGGPHASIGFYLWIG